MNRTDRRNLLKNARRRGLDLGPLEQLTESFGMPDSFPGLRPAACRHRRLQPTFDVRAAQELNLTSEEIRIRWPRAEGACPDCGQNLIMYANTAHYVMGEWPTAAAEPEPSL